MMFYGKVLKEINYACIIKPCKGKMSFKVLKYLIQLTIDTDWLTDHKYHNTFKDVAGFC